VIVTEAVLLGSVDYGDADRIVTLYTRSHGKVGAMARAARKSRRRFGAALAPFVVAEATLRERRGAELMLLEGFHARRDFSRLGEDVVRLGHASYATELVRELSAAHRPDEAILELLVELYQVVAAQPPRADVLRAFELQLLDELGLRPALDRCVGCDTGAGLDRAILDAGRGGLLCPSCAGGATGTVRLLPAEARARLLLLRDGSLADAAARPPAPATEAAARDAVHALLGAHLAGPLRSLEFLRKLARA
jgi:DNA repair protein RecO (recombination protein O)